MPQGLQIFDASGTLQLDVGSSLARSLGTVDTGSTSGSITVSEFSLGVAWVVVLVTDGAWPGIPPTVSISGTTLSWTIAGYQKPAVLVYGIS